MTHDTIKTYTDYPFEFLGDEPNKEAPIRECTVLHWDGNKYVSIIVEDQPASIKIAYLYKDYGRFGEVPVIDCPEISL